MTTEQAKQLQEIYDKFNVPSGMFTKELTSMDMSVELSNTIIDYTKLQTSNFSLKGEKASFKVTGNSGAWTSMSTGSGAKEREYSYLSYNNITGIIEYVGGYGWSASSGSNPRIDTFAGTICLNCDISSCLKSNWKEFYSAN